MIGKDETTWTENENLNMETTWTENENLNMVTEHVKLNMINWTSYLRRIWLIAFSFSSWKFSLQHFPRQMGGKLDHRLDVMLGV
jgi:hypothetical protein